MTIQTTLGALATAEPALHKLAGLIWPPKLAYHVRKLCKLVGSETQHFHEQREAWIRELGAEAEDKSITVTEANKPEYFRRLKELAAVEVAIPWQPLPLEALDSADDPDTKQPAKLSAADLEALGDLITYEADHAP